VRYENDVTAEGLQESLTLVGQSSAGRPALPASGFVDSWRLQLHLSSGKPPLGREGQCAWD
jgi:hypothetical protein